jgi:hypothetical protein
MEEYHMKKIAIATVASFGLAAAVSAQPASAPIAGDITRAAAVADAERQFAALDVNRNGQLEAEEMQRARGQGQGDRRQRMQERLAQMSPEDRARFEQRRAERRNNGGAVDGEGGGLRRGGNGARGPVTLAQFRTRAERRFDRLDLNGDGVITAAEQEQLRAQRAAD